MTKYNFTSVNKTIEEKMEEVFLATNLLEDFAIGFAQYHLNQTTPQLYLSSENIGK